MLLGILNLMLGKFYVLYVLDVGFWNDLKVPDILSKFDINSEVHVGFHVRKCCNSVNKNERVETIGGNAGGGSKISLRGDSFMGKTLSAIFRGGLKKSVSKRDILLCYIEIFKNFGLK